MYLIHNKKCNGNQSKFMKKSEETFVLKLICSERFLMKAPFSGFLNYWPLTANFWGDEKLIQN